MLFVVGYITPVLSNNQELCIEVSVQSRPGTDMIGIKFAQMRSGRIIKVVAQATLLPLRDQFGVLALLGGNYSGLATPMRRPAHSFGAGRLLAQVAMAVRQVRR